MDTNVCIEILGGDSELALLPMPMSVLMPVPMSMPRMVSMPMVILSII